MSNRGLRRSPVQQKTIEEEARAEAIRAIKLGFRAAINSERAPSPKRGLSIREKIARWLEEKL